MEYWNGGILEYWNDGLFQVSHVSSSMFFEAGITYVETLVIKKVGLLNLFDRKY